MRLDSFALLVICVVGLLVGEKGRVDGEFETPPCDSTFSCLLRNFTVVIDNFETTTHGLKVTLTDLTCTGFSLGHVDSSLDLEDIEIGTEGDPSWALGVNFTDIGLFCETDFKYRLIDSPLRGSGDVSIALYGTHLDMAIVIEDDEEEERGGKRGDLSSCEFVLDVSEAKLESNAFTKSILKSFEGAIYDAVEQALNEELCDNIFFNLVNNDLTNALAFTERFHIPPPPPLPPLDAPPGVVNFTDTRILEVLAAFNDRFGAVLLNFIVNHFTNNGTVSFGSGEILEFEAVLPVSLPTSFGEGRSFVLKGEVEEGEVSGLSSFTNFTFLDPIGDTELETVLELGEFEVKFSTLFEIVLIEEEEGKKEGNRTQEVIYKSESEFSLVSLDDKLVLVGQAFIPKSELNRTIHYPLSLASPACDSLLISNLTFLEIMLSFGEGHVDFLAIDDESGVGQLLDNLVLLVVRSLGEGLVRGVENLVGGMGRGWIDELVQGGLDEAHEEAGECMPNFPTKDDHWRYQAKVFSYLTAFLLSIAVMGFLSYTYVKRKVQEKTSEVSPLVNPYEPSANPPLGLHPEIPWFIRTGVPTLLFILLATFISSNTGTGANVLIDIDFETTNMDSISLVNGVSLFRFSLWNSVHDMWEAGVYPLSLMIFIFSGVWPYTKLFLMLFCWLTPTKGLSPKTREYLLTMLDALGKWSLIDTYVLVLMLVAFRFEIGVGFITINLIVQPKPGFYLFLGATIGSLLMTHLMVAIHRHVRFPAAVRHFESDHVHPLYSLSFPLGGKLVKCTEFGVIFVPVLIVVAFAFVVWGSVVESFVFTFGGIAGWALHEDASASYSLVSVGQAIADSVENPGPGTWFIQACFYIFALAVPLSHLICLFLLWLVPMSGGAQRSVFVLAEVLNAWSALEVFVISIIAALLEISQFAAFIVGDDCDPIDKILHIPFLDHLVDGDDTCFDVVATLSNGCWILFAACAVYVFCRMSVMHVCHESLEYRYARGKKLLEKEKKNKHVQDDEDEDNDLVVVDEDAGIVCRIGVALCLVNYAVE